MLADALTLNLIVAAAGVAIVHTALGPDHTLPFVALARARQWSRTRTLWITAVCGVVHILSSLTLGLIGLGAGLAVGSFEAAEAGRGRWAAWSLVAFGFAYGLWGVRRAWTARRGIALHAHASDTHLHAHSHVAHEHAEPTHSVTVWALIVVFLLGPCEPLIPLFVIPASEGRWSLAAATAVTFGVITLVTMLALVALAHGGLQRLQHGVLERWSHALAGSVLVASGAAVLFLGL